MMRLSLADNGNSENPAEPGIGGKSGIDLNGSISFSCCGMSLDTTSKLRRLTTDRNDVELVVGLGGVDGLLNDSPVVSM